MALSAKITPSGAVLPLKARTLPYWSNRPKIGITVRIFIIFAFTAFYAAQANADTAYVVKVLAHGKELQVKLLRCMME